jgi:hypothetical protein
MTSAAVHEALAKPRRHLRTTVAKSL